jgi:hypothetical protein
MDAGAGEKPDQAPENAPTSASNGPGQSHDDTLSTNSLL